MLYFNMKTFSFCITFFFGVGEEVYTRVYKTLRAFAIEENCLSS